MRNGLDEFRKWACSEECRILGELIAKFRAA